MSIDQAWRSAFRGFSAPTRLWLDRGTPDPSALRVRHVGYLDDRLCSALAAARFDAGPESLLCAAWALLLARKSGEKTVLVATATPAADGCVVLPVRVEVESAARVSDWIAELAERRRRLRLTAPARLADLARLNAGAPALIQSVVCSGVPASALTRSFAFVLALPYPAGGCLEVVCDCGRFDEDAALRNLRAFVRVLMQLTGSPSARLSDLEPPAEASLEGEPFDEELTEEPTPEEGVLCGSATEARQASWIGRFSEAKILDSPPDLRDRF